MMSNVREDKRAMGVRAASVAVAAMLAGALCAPAAAHAEYRGHQDLDEGHWAVPEVIDWSKDHRAVNGFPDGSWAPDAPITREQVATIIHNASGAPVPAGPATFADAGQLTWSADAVAWCQQQGIFTGSGNLMMPADPITREQVAKVLMVYAGGAEADDAALAAFADGAEVSGWARGVCSWAARSGVIKGAQTPAGAMLMAQAGCTRAEFVAMLMRTSDGVRAGRDLSGMRYEAAREWVVDYEDRVVDDYEDRWVPASPEECYHNYCSACGEGVYIPMRVIKYGGGLPNCKYTYPEHWRAWQDGLHHIETHACGSPDCRADGEIVVHAPTVGGGWESVKVGSHVERVEAGGHWEYGQGSWVRA